MGSWLVGFALSCFLYSEAVPNEAPIPSISRLELLKVSSPDRRRDIFVKDIDIGHVAGQADHALAVVERPPARWGKVDGSREVFIDRCAGHHNGCARAARHKRLDIKVIGRGISVLHPDPGMGLRGVSRRLAGVLDFASDLDFLGSIGLVRHFIHSDPGRHDGQVSTHLSAANALGDCDSLSGGLSGLNGFGEHPIGGFCRSACVVQGFDYRPESEGRQDNGNESRPKHELGPVRHLLLGFEIPLLTFLSVLLLYFVHVGYQIADSAFNAVERGNKWAGLSLFLIALILSVGGAFALAWLLFDSILTPDWLKAP